MAVPPLGLQKRGLCTPPGALRQVGQDGGDVAAQEEVLGFPLLLGFELFQKFHFAACEDGEGDAVAIEDAVAAERRHPGAGCQDADEVEWVGA